MVRIELLLLTSVPYIHTVAQNDILKWLCIIPHIQRYPFLFFIRWAPSNQRTKGWTVPLPGFHWCFWQQDTRSSNAVLPPITGTQDYTAYLTPKLNLNIYCVLQYLLNVFFTSTRLLNADTIYDKLAIIIKQLASIYKQLFLCCYRKGYLSSRTELSPTSVPNFSLPTVTVSYPNIPTLLHSKTVCHGEKPLRKTKCLAKYISFGLLSQKRFCLCSV